jgi:hypothetical protein
MYAHKCTSIHSIVIDARSAQLRHQKSLLAAVQHLHIDGGRSVIASEGSSIGH